MRYRSKDGLTLFTLELRTFPPPCKSMDILDMYELELEMEMIVVLLRNARSGTGKLGVFE